MTVSTPYFDYVFESREEVSEELTSSEKTYNRLERKEDRLEALVATRPTPRRLRRLERVQILSDIYEEEIKILTEELEDLNSVELPQDEAEFSFYRRDDEITGIKLTLTDSPYDDTFVGGVKTAFYLRGSGKYNGNGWASFASRSSAIPETFEDGTDEFLIGGSLWSNRLDGSYPEVTVSLLQGYDFDQHNSGEHCFETSVYAAGVPQLA